MKRTPLIKYVGKSRLILGEYMSITLSKYPGQFQIGITFCVHKHSKWHGHFFADLGKYYLQVTFGDGQ